MVKLYDSYLVADITIHYTLLQIYFALFDFADEEEEEPQPSTSRKRGNRRV